MIFFFAKIMWETDANDYTMYFFNHVFKNDHPHAKTRHAIYVIIILYGLNSSSWCVCWPFFFSTHFFCFFHFFEEILRIFISKKDKTVLFIFPFFCTISLYQKYQESYNHTCGFCLVLKSTRKEKLRNETLFQVEQLSPVIYFLPFFEKHNCLFMNESRRCTSRFCTFVTLSYFFAIFPSFLLYLFYDLGRKLR